MNTYTVNFPKFFWKSSIINYLNLNKNTKYHKSFICSLILKKLKSNYKGRYYLDQELLNILKKNTNYNFIWYGVSKNRLLYYLNFVKVKKSNILLLKKYNNCGIHVKKLDF